MENNIIVTGNFVTGTTLNTSPKTGKALSYVESINEDGSLNLKVIATIYDSEHDNGIHDDGYFRNRQADAYVVTSIYDYVKEKKDAGYTIYFQEWFESYAVKEKCDSVREGALVIGNRYNHYSITNNETLCFVKSVGRYNEMTVVTLTNYLSSDAFEVDVDKFKPISIEEYFAKFPNAPKNKNYKKYVFGGYYDYTPETDGNNGIMDLKHREYEISDEVVAHQTEALMKAYGMYKYAVTEDGCENKVRLCNEAKKGIRNILSNLPEWDAEKCYARFSINWERPIVPERITEFTEWFKKELKNIYAEKNFVPCGMTRNELRESLRRVQGTISLMNDLLSLNNITPTAYQAVTLGGFNLNYYEEELDRLNKVKDLFYQENYLYNRGKEIFLSKEDGELYFNTVFVLDHLEGWVLSDGHKLSAQLSEIINQAFKNCHKANGKALIRVNEGMKLSRFISQLGKLTGVDKVVSMETKSWWENGIYHERQFDNGWNGRFAKFADGINPFSIPRHTIISTNPVDYVFASHGNNWTSCHFLCREELNVSGSYRAMYSGGNDGYMTDPSTVVMYMINEDYDGKDFEFEPKERRCLFHIGEDKMIQGRVYPDGRDGGELGASRQMRNIMQTMIAKALGVPNLWKVEEGTSPIYPYQETKGRNYPDYSHYDDCTISFLKGNNSEYVINPVKITIGSKATCPVCGERHLRADWVYCYNHEDYYDNRHKGDNSSYMVDSIEGADVKTCERCGCIIEDEDDMVQDCDTGNYYCNWECAENDDCYYCDNVGEWHSNHVYYDEYRERYFYDSSDYEHIITVDGRHYEDEYSAEEDNYRCTADDEWYPEDELYYCEECNQWFTEENWDFDHNMCRDCAENCEEE